MSQFVQRIRQQAKAKPKRLILPEGTEPRTIAAAPEILRLGLAQSVTLLGNQEAILEKARELKVDLTGVSLIDPLQAEKLDEYSEAYYQMRKHKGVDLGMAKATLGDVLHFGAMMVHKGEGDAMVAGADNSTGNVLRAAFTIIGTAPQVRYASSCFVMEFEDQKWGHQGLMIFADCATIPDPNPEQLAEITLASAVSCRDFLCCEPVIAMLSFSTKGSAKHPMVDKVVEALAIVKEKNPHLEVDGEMQADAALVQEVGEKKAPGSKVSGRVNTLIFPDLGVGNIGYKMVQRFAGAQAYGPFLQGFAKPVSDLSRGCTIEEIINTSAATLSQGE